MEFIRELLKKDATKKILVFLLLVLFFYAMRGMLDLFLLTFLFTYLTYKIQNFVVTRMRKYIKVNQLLVTIIIFSILFVSLALVIYEYIPIIINQGISIINEISKFNLQSDPNGFVGKYVIPAVEQIDFKSYSKAGADYLVKLATNVGKWGFNVFVSLMLSMFFMLEKDKIRAFMGKFKDSKIKGVYKYIRYFWHNFLNSFGKVMEAQIMIAVTNSVLSVIALSFMGFPQLLGLGIMIFILSLVPVAGVIISLVPLSMIAFNIGGFLKVFYVIVMIAALHGLETYILNPKFMSIKTELPVFLTFIVLIVSEHFMGMWGLLIGVPLFTFILDILKVTKKDDEVID